MSSSQKIFNRMSIFRKWKFQSRHTKLTEEWALATSTKDLSEINDEQQEDEQNVTKFSLKYLGKTSIDAERSQNATAEAIKSVITNSKTMRNNNNKKSQRVHLIVCPKGIEMRDEQTDDILLRVSIYKISYCSADAAHDHVFAFIGSENDKDTNDEKLSCYVFLCPKRRIAHDVTLTVARCFENAYQNWRNSIEHKMFSSKTNNNNKTLSSLESSINESKLSTSSSQNGSTDDLLIDLTQEGSNSNSNNINTNKTTTEICEKNHRNYLQNTWVSFDDEQIDVRQQLFQENSSWDTQQLVF